MNILSYPEYTSMDLVKVTFAAGYCGCYATRLQLLNTTIFDGAPQSLKLLTSLAALWQCLVNEKPEWVVVTSCQLEREPEFLNILREQYRSIGIILCVMPDSPPHALLWPLLRRFEPDTICTLVELAACLTALKAKQHYHSCLVAVFSQLASMLPNSIEYQQITPPLKSFIR